MVRNAERKWGWNLAGHTLCLCIGLTAATVLEDQYERNYIAANLVTPALLLNGANVDVNTSAQNFQIASGKLAAARHGRNRKGVAVATLGFCAAQKKHQEDLIARRAMAKEVCSVLSERHFLTYRGILENRKQEACAIAAAPVGMTPCPSG